METMEHLNEDMVSYFSENINTNLGFIAIISFIGSIAFAIGFIMLIYTSLEKR